MKPDEILQHAKERTGKFRYLGSVWTGIRVTATSFGQAKKFELSRWSGEVGSLKIQTTTIYPQTDVEVLK